MTSSEVFLATTGILLFQHYLSNSLWVRFENLFKSTNILTNNVGIKIGEKIGDIGTQRSRKS